MSSKAKDIIGVICGIITVVLLVAIWWPDQDREPHAIPADDAANSSAPAGAEHASGDPLRDQFEDEWAGLDTETQDAYCWALESMTPDELAEFGGFMTDADPADWIQVSKMIDEKCQV